MDTGMVLKKQLAWSMAWMMVVVVWLLSLLPLSSPVESVQGSDKLGHFLAYFVMAYWFMHLTSKNWLVATLFLGMGLMIEIVQSLTTYRFFEWTDLLANTAGVLLAFGVFSVAKVQLKFLLTK